MSASLSVPFQQKLSGQPHTEPQENQQTNKTVTSDMQTEQT
jgi:hypothetical protein